RYGRALFSDSLLDNPARQFNEVVRRIPTIKHFSRSVLKIFPRLAIGFGAAVASLGVATGVTRANAAVAVGAFGANLAVRTISTAVGDSTWLDVETAGVLTEAAGTVVGKCMAGFVYDEQEKWLSKIFFTVMPMARENILRHLQG
ncbi:hypothetical protein, partial [Endozoicomonas sp. ONNA2]|uniref:hypothetical protein n=1 Tax=Endozoicomonas sp. ONNA2 TaxID=2828741 RepID=UPI0021482A63